MLSSVDSLSGIPLVSGLFMISFPASGRMTKTTFHQKTVSLKCNRPKGKRKAIKLPVILPVRHPDFFLCWNAGSSNQKIHSFSSSGFITSSSCPFPARRDLLTRSIWLLPVTGPLSALPPSSGKNGSVIAGKMAVPPVIANVIIPSRIVTGDGTPIGNVISSVTTSTCMWPPIPIVTFPYSLF